MPDTPVMLATLTEVGAAALLDVQLGGGPVRLVAASIGSAARVTTGAETTLTTSVATALIAESEVDEAARRFDIGAIFAGADVVAEHEVREIGLFDDQDRLIFYWSTDAGSIGAITPRSDYAIAFSVTLLTAPLSSIEIIDQGASFELLLKPRLIALENRVTNGLWRNLFLAQSS